MKYSNIFLSTVILALINYNLLFAQWTQTTVPQYGGDVYAIAINGSDIFVAAGSYTWPNFPNHYGGGLFLTTDNGDSWTSTGFTNTPVKAIAVIGTNLYASTYSGVFVSTNNGSTWSPSALFSDFNCLLQKGSNLLLGTSNGVLRSTDNGVSWSSLGPTNTNVSSIATLGSKIFFSGSFNLGQINAIYYSIDDGVSWNYVIPKNNLTIQAVSVSGSNVLAGTSGGIYYSTDSGGNWLSGGLTSHWVSTFAKLDTILFTATEDGVYKSTNNGIEWTKVSIDISSISVLALNQTYLFVGTDFFMWRCLLSEMTPVLENHNDLPRKYILRQNYPNPFNPTTKINYSVPKASFVNIKVYDIMGRVITTLVNKEKQFGNYEVKFDGSKLPSGIYFYKMQADNFSETKKFILLK